MRSYRVNGKCPQCANTGTLRFFIDIDEKVAFLDCSWCGFREDLIEG